MAALIGPAISAISRLIGGTGFGATFARGALSGVGAVAAVDLLKAIQDDLGSGDATRIGHARRVPQYAIVDLHANKVVRTLSSKHVYSILTHPRRKPSRARKVEFIQVPSGTNIERVR